MCKKTKNNIYVITIMYFFHFNIKAMSVADTLIPVINELQRVF